MTTVIKHIFHSLLCSRRTWFGSIMFSDAASALVLDSFSTRRDLFLFPSLLRCHISIRGNHKALFRAQLLGPGNHIIKRCLDWLLGMIGNIRILDLFSFRQNLLRLSWKAEASQLATAIIHLVSFILPHRSAHKTNFDTNLHNQKPKIFQIQFRKK